jgi:hypothetical protein
MLTRQSSDFLCGRIQERTLVRVGMKENSQPEFIPHIFMHSGGFMRMNQTKNHLCTVSCTFVNYFLEKNVFALPSGGKRK